MKIESLVSGYQGAALRSAQESGQGFAACLAHQFETRQSLGAAEVDAELARVKEMGFTGFFAELVAKRLAELRKEVLAEMGLTEADLAKMDPETRDRMEKIIVQRIRERLEAEGDKKKEKVDGMGPLESLRYRASMAWKPDLKEDV